MPFRTFVTGCVAVGLMLWGPDTVFGFGGWSGPALAAFGGLAAWLLFGHWWRRWNPTRLQQEKFSNALTAAFAGAFLMLAINATQQSYHFECSQYAGNGASRECVGEYERVEGPGVVEAYIFGVLAFITFGVAISEKSNDGH